MGRVRLRTKFLVAMLLTSAGLTAVSLLIVQRTVENQVRRDLGNDLANSVETFRNAQKDREAVLARSAKPDGRSSQPEGAHDISSSTHHSGCIG